MRKAGKAAARDARDKDLNASTFAGMGMTLIGIAVAFAIFCVCSIMYTVTTVTKHVGDLKYIELTSESELKEVLFSGNPHVVVCSYKNGNAFRHTEQAAQQETRKEIQWVFIDCDRKLPSGKTIPERVKLSAELPQGFVSTGDRYWQFSKGDADTLVEFIRHALKPRTIEVKAIADFKKKCADTPACVVIGYHHKLNTTVRDAVLAEHASNRKVRVVSVNAQKFQLAVDAKFMATRPKRTEHFTTVLGLSITAAASLQMAATAEGKFVQDALSSTEIAALFAAVQRTSGGFVKLSSPPTMQAREHKLAKKKAEKEEADENTAAKETEASDEENDEEDNFVILKAASKEEL